MTTGFVKVYSTILDSSIWAEAYPTRLVWITMLAMAGADGRVEASVGGLARRAQVTRDECVRALETLLAPDPDDKSGVDEGRRITVCPKGWHITNHQAYRDLRSEKQVKTAERVRKYREQHSVTGNACNTVKHTVRPEAEAEADQDPPMVPQGTDPGLTLVPDDPPAPPRPRPPKRAAPIPADWTPTAEHRALAERYGLDLALEVIGFKGFFDGQAVKSPNGRFSTWLAKSAKCGPPRGRAPMQPAHGVTGLENARRIHD